MKKFFLVGLMTISTISLMAINPATFENETGGINLTTPESNWQGSDSPVDGKANWKSGDFNFQTNVNYGGTYFEGFTVTNETTKTSTGYTQAYRSVSGGAYAGDNFAVWYPFYLAQDTVSFAAQTVAGFFVNNTSYVVGSFTTNNFPPARQFTINDYLVLKCTGLKNKAEVGTIEVYLAKEGKYIGKWTYVDLSTLGEIDAILFSMDGTDKGAYGLNTATYFAMDNFGASKPIGYVAPEMIPFEVATDIEDIETAAPACKFFRNGQIFIMRDGKVFDITGAQIQ